LAEVARTLGLTPAELEPYGSTRAKVRLEALQALPPRPRGKYVVVTAITPTPLGEGKTVHTIGLAMALNRLGKRAVCTVRQPSLGPIFGQKGGASGGGRTQIVPPQDLNLHLTGDFHAVTAANNLLAAFLDTSLLLDNPLRIVPDTITWRRVLDVNDRALREIEIGLGGPQNGVPRRTGFDITAASEVMAILGLAHDLRDLRERLGRIVVAHDQQGRPVTAEHLRCAGAMAALLRDALAPTLMQTSEGTPALVHTGPFANIAHGNSSIVADRIALAAADFVVTEAGFGADMGAEKFCNIKCRVSGLRPDAAVVVATVRALKMHSGRVPVVAGRPLPPELLREDRELLRAGAPNLEAQIQNVRVHGIPAVVAVNRFPTDTDAELELVRELALRAGASAAHASTLYRDGGRGAEELAAAVVRAADEPSSFRFLYPEDASLPAKIETLATRIYGADGVDYADAARSKLETFAERGYGHFPVCMAKTQYSLSHDPARKGRPRGYRFLVQDARVAVGAGFVIPLAGAITTMPGYGRSPGGQQIDLDEAGNVIGLF
jgi:formate--tetrahydrofolate ligase